MEREVNVNVATLCLPPQEYECTRMSAPLPQKCLDPFHKFEQSATI